MAAHPQDAGPATTGAVLAGGRGSRLGRPKATACLAGRPLIEYPLGALREAGLAPVVVAKPDSRLPAVEVPVWREPAQPRHPLCGIVHALRRAHGPLVVVGCDMPLVPPALLTWLAELPDRLVVVEAAGRMQPLLARYAPSAADHLAAALAEEAPLQEAVRGLAPRIASVAEVACFGDPALICANVNKPGDLERIEALVAGETV